MSHDRTITVLFESESLKVSEFACGCGYPHKSGEEAAHAHEVVLPQKGFFERTTTFGRTQGDPTKALYFNKGQPYRIDHPLGGGDVCTIFEVSPAVLMDFCASEEDRNRVLEGCPFARGEQPLGHHLALHHFALLQNAKRLGEAGALAFEERALAFLARIFEDGAPRRTAKPKPAAKRALEAQKHLVERTIRYLNRHFTDALMLSKLAREVFSSPYHLCRVFRRETGLTIHGYLSVLRLRAALDALREKGRKLTPLALDLGFSSHSHFSASFAKAFGATPKTVRDLLN